MPIDVTSTVKVDVRATTSFACKQQKELFHSLKQQIQHRSADPIGLFGKEPPKHLSKFSIKIQQIKYHYATNDTFQVDRLRAKQ
jgi:hypothetical protein